MNNRVKELRQQRHISQSALAEVVQCDRSSISYFEIGHAGMSVERLIKIADFFDVSLDYLLCRTDCPARQILLNDDERKNLQ